MASRAPEWRESVKRGAIRSGALIGAIALALGALLLVLALASYRPSDPSMNTAAGGPVNNLLGLPGAWISDFLLWLLGPCVGLFVPQMLINARRLWAKVSVLGWKRRARSPPPDPSGPMSSSRRAGQRTSATEGCRRP